MVSQAAVLIVLGFFNLAYSVEKKDKPDTPSTNKKRTYQSTFAPATQISKKVLRTGQILGPDEEPHHMMERVAKTIACAEELFPQFSKRSKLDLEKKLGALMDAGDIVFSTPILTNAGRFQERPLSACAMPPISLKSDLKEIKRIVDQYHQDGMGTGYNLSDVDDPINMLIYLNSIAVEGAHSNKEQRPVGNMAILNVHSPAIEKFIELKTGADERGEDWKFNLSVDVTDDFMAAVEQNGTFKLWNGKEISAAELFKKMAQGAHACGDPGLISIERLNADNPTPLLSDYQCTSPCAEVGLAPGETCVFGYINLARFVDKKSIDFDRLKSTVNLLTHALDNVLEISIQRYAVTESKKIMQAKRKIGIGICGFADMLIALNLSYDQQEARDLLQDIVTFINYSSKEASVKLAQERGPFTGFSNSRFKDENFIINKFGNLATPHVTTDQWIDLAHKIKQRGLRNATTVSLPPTGRSSLVIGASAGIEPIFSFCNPEGPENIDVRLYDFLRKYPRRLREAKESGCCPKTIRELHPFVTATELTPADHLAMAVAAQKGIDESISKTINLPENATIEEVEHVYRKAYALGLKGISVYRNHSRNWQPKALAKENSEGK